MTSVGEPDDQIIVETYQDNHAIFKYSPQGAWTTTPPNIETFAAGNGQWVTRSELLAALSLTLAQSGTATVGASVELKFKVCLLDPMFFELSERIAGFVLEDRPHSQVHPLTGLASNTR